MLAPHIGVLILVLSGPGNASNTPQVRELRHGDDRLKGITAVDVVIDPVAADGTRCGLAREAIQQVTVTALQSAGLKATVRENASSAFFTVYVTATTVRSGSQCATSLVTDLMAHVEGAQDGGLALVGEMSLIRHQGVVSSTRAAHTAQVHSVLSDHLKAIGSRVASAKNGG